ncbi:MAG: hypothetical protein DMG05_16580 [Acidobacteria bacterium]|nr:MAG: hypothetical protein DMG05_16580 [Acidobacteriota bacterium]
MNTAIPTTVRIELRNGKLRVYHNVTNIDYDDPFSKLKIYSGYRLLDALPLGDIRKWRFERARGSDRRHDGRGKPPPEVAADRRGSERRRQPASSQFA